MKWKDRERKERKSEEIIIRKTFAFFPIKIKGEKRWLEFVKIKGYWWKGASGNWWWESIDFVD